eukprot:CAMPEP_0168458842 /NCGR_PEP_ID=MMETSP0228-20121227/52598_1 /TAXON_ID=133427 /ORGANISM="Protoceratium reticulatum, Strain CCCM 535 (=CCMP 1889)" /LENGTH=549 /DNA_ID=CAMNT_0008473979 /DNA_START=69 /DNA_END=1718 /DNA_ORIENTATION=+
MLADPLEQPVTGTPAVLSHESLSGLLRLGVKGDDDPAKICDVLALAARAHESTHDEPDYAWDIATYLNHPSAVVQREACLALLNMRQAGAPHIGRVHALLRSDDMLVRSAAAEALGAIGPRGTGEATRLGIAELLGDQVLVRCAALKAIGLLGDVSLLDRVVKCLSDTSQQVAAASCLSLGLMGARISQEHVDLLAQRLDEASTRPAALEALAALGEDVAGRHSDRVVSQCLPDPDVLTRERAILAIGSFAGSVAGDEGLMERIVEQLRSQEPFGRCAAALALGHLGLPALARAQSVAALLEDSGEDKTGLALQVSGAFMRQPAAMKKPRCAALTALGMMGKAWAEQAGDSDEWEFESKIEVMLRDEDWEVRACALGAVLEMGEKSKVDVDIVAELLEDETHRVRMRACNVLGVLKAADKVEQLSDLFDDSAPSVRAAALLAVGSIGEDAADHAAKIFKRLSDHVDAVRAAAVRAVGQLGEYGRCFAGVLVEVIQEEHSAEVRKEILEALAQMENYGAAFADEIAEFLDDEAESVRVAAMGALKDLRCY